MTFKRGKLMCAIECYSYSDYKMWEGDWELIDGHPVSMAPAPVKKHQILSGKIFSEFLKYLEECEECEVLIEEDYKIDDYTVLRPDVAVVCDDPNEEYISKAPEIIVEVISPSSAKKDEKIKFEIYEKEKVKYYVLIYPDDLKAKIFKLNGKIYEKEGDFFMEDYKFKISCKEIKIDFKEVFKRFRKNDSR